MIYKVLAWLIVPLLIIAVFLSATNTPFKFRSLVSTASTFNAPVSLQNVITQLQESDWQINSDWEAFNFLRDFINTLLSGLKGILLLGVLLAQSVVNLVALLYTLLAQVWSGV